MYLRNEIIHRGMTRMTGMTARMRNDDTGREAGCESLRERGWMLIMIDWQRMLIINS